MKIGITKPLAILIAVCSLISPAQAALASPQNELFNQFKQLESLSHLGRIAILQEAEVCLQQAQSREAFRACEEKEKQARLALREELRPQRELLRAEMQSRQTSGQMNQNRHPDEF